MVFLKSLFAVQEYCCFTSFPSYKCNFCKYKSFLKVSLLNHQCHVRLKQNKVKFQRCPYCRIRSFSILWLYFHLTKYNGECGKISNKWYDCDECNKKFRKESTLNDHKLLKHFMEGSTYFKCEKCPYSTVRKRALQYHMSSKHKKARFKCPSCDYAASFKNHLNVHIYHKHTPTDQIKWLVCPYCDMKIKRMGDLNRHITTKHPNGLDKLEEAECDQCDIICPTQGLLQIHKLTDHAKDGGDDDELSIDDI